MFIKDISGLLDWAQKGLNEGQRAISDYAKGGAKIDRGVALTVACVMVSDEDARPDFPGDLPMMQRLALASIGEITGMTPRTDIRPAEVVSRRQWLENLQGNAAILVDEVMTRVGGEQGGKVLGGLGADWAGATGKLAVSAQLGAITGLLGGRVQGEYDNRMLAGTGEPRLMLLTENMRQAAEKMGVNAEQYATWVLVHELTHAVQFTANPWLTAWMREQITDMISEISETVRAKKITNPAALSKHPNLARMQAAMSLVEGHAEKVMDDAGRPLIPTLAELREKMDGRRADPPVITKLITQMLGMDQKMRQYIQGRTFCDAVVDHGGHALLTHAFTDATTLPRPDELTDPQGWIARVA